jgi:hypothetical protein
VFQSLVNRAQRSVDSLISKYVARAAVAVPFIIAMGFGTAAAAVKLTAEYGSMTAYTILAGAFAAIGLVAAVAIAMVSPQPAASPEATPEQTAAAQNGEAADEEAVPELPVDPAMVLSMLTTLGPALTPYLLRVLTRNLPLLTGLAIVAYLLFADAGRSKPSADASAEAA